MYSRRVLFSTHIQQIGIGLLLLLPWCTFAYTSVGAWPSDQHAVLELAHPNEAQEQFGTLADFPHTFEFEVKETMPFKATIFVVDDAKQKNDAALIVVKAEERGVSEVGRTIITNDTWDRSYDYLYAETFRKGGTLQGTLQPGWYKLEVSAPNNDASYRLVWGTTEIHRGYFANVRALFEAKRALGHSLFGVVLSPLIYVPLLILSVLSVGIYWWKKRNQQDFV